MLRQLLAMSGLLLLAGCFAPFSWPEQRRETVADIADAPVEESEPLTRAARCLEVDDESGAVPHLRAHLATYPDALMIRAYLGELLMKLGRSAEAEVELSRVIAESPVDAGAMTKPLIHCHTRLMELAQTTNDTFREELHRGVGLFRLVQQWRQEPASHDPTLTQQTLAKAAAALRAAQELAPDDPRPALYLAEVYEQLGQIAAARWQRRQARNLLPYDRLSTAEREWLARP